MFNIHTPVDTISVQRWRRVNKEDVSVDQPRYIKSYNHFMEGLDMVDQMLACYRNKLRKRKWQFLALEPECDDGECMEALN